MIEALVIATTVCLFFAIAIGILIAIIEDDFSPIIGIPMFFVWVVVGFAALIYATKQENEKGPCLEYQTQMTWNAATKTMMPARICVARGEWVK